MSDSYADCDDVAVNRAHEHTSAQREDQIASEGRQANLGRIGFEMEPCDWLRNCVGRL